MDSAELIKRMKQVTFDKKQQSNSQAIRAEALRLADRINTSAKDGREKSLAITAVEEAVMWANRAIAVNPEH